MRWRRLVGLVLGVVVLSWPASASAYYSMTWSDPLAFSWSTQVTDPPMLFGTTDSQTYMPLITGLTVMRANGDQLAHNPSENPPYYNNAFGGASCNTSFTPWVPTGTWAFAGSWLGEWGFVTDDNPPESFPAGYTVYDTGGGHPGESRWTWGLVTEPLNGYHDGSGGWDPREVYTGGSEFTDSRPPNVTHRQSAIYAYGSRNANGTYRWKAKWLFGSNFFTLGSRVITGTIEVTSSATPPTISAEFRTSNLGAKIPVIYLSWFSGANQYSSTVISHYNMAAEMMWRGGTTNAYEVSQFSPLVDSMVLGASESTVPPPPPPPSEETSSWTGWGFGWTDAAMSAVASSVAGMSSSMTSWFWPITQMGGW